MKLKHHVLAGPSHHPQMAFDRFALHIRVHHVHRRFIGLDIIAREQLALHLAHNGLERGGAVPHPVASVLLGGLTPSRAKICCCRYSGRWSTYLAKITCATRLLSALPLRIRLGGKGAMLTPARPHLQASFGRIISWRITLAGMYSKRSLFSQPISHFSLPQWGHTFSSGSSRSVTVSTLLIANCRRGRGSGASVDGTTTSLVAGASAGGGNSESKTCSLESVLSWARRSELGP